MGAIGVTVWCTCICAALFALAQCIPVDVYYTNDACNCKPKLNYEVTVPKIAKPKEYPHHEYGYKLDVPPIEAKGKVSYSFDFTVEEPKTAKPKVPEKWDLYAKIDRIAIPKKDCIHKSDDYYKPKEYKHKETSSYPGYRYVYQTLTPAATQPCQCKRPECAACSGDPSVYFMKIIRPLATGNEIPEDDLEKTVNGGRKKRDLQRVFFRPRHQDYERSRRYVKQYHTSLPEKQTPAGGLFNLGIFKEPLLRIPPSSKRKTKKVLFPRLVKRDIKGEYDLLEKENAKLDLTLPEIVQYMPEVLHPNFKRGPCRFGCSQTNQLESGDKASEAKEIDSNQVKETENDSSFKIDVKIQTNDEPNAQEKIDEKATNDFETEKETPTSNSSKKRNVGVYRYETQRLPSFSSPTATQFFNPIASQQNKVIPIKFSVSPLPEYEWQRLTSQNQIYKENKPLNYNLNQNAVQYSNPTPSPCDKHRKPLIQPIPKPQKIINANNYVAIQPTYAYDSYNNKFFSSPITAPDPIAVNDIPLQYSGDLLRDAYENPKQSMNMHQLQSYPVQQISSGLFDRIIHDIIHRHPDYVQDSTYNDGSLVDAEPWQEQETKSFLEKIFGFPSRKSLWYGDDADDGDDAYSSYYSNAQLNSHTPLHSSYNAQKPTFGHFAL